MKSKKLQQGIQTQGCIINDERIVERTEGLHQNME